MKVLVLDVGTSGVRAAIVHDDITVVYDHYQELLPDSPGDGLVQFDATLLATTTIECARAAIESTGRVDGVGISNQRASTVVWDARDARPIGPALGWQDLRTIGLCFAAREHGLRFAPNQSATKAQWLFDTYAADLPREHLRFGTVDTWITWVLSEGAAHVTDATNAGVTGLQSRGIAGWNDAALEALGIPIAAMPLITDSAGIVGAASILPGSPPIAALLGDQQASLAGQACVGVGDAKITFGTGGMLDMCLGPDSTHSDQRNTNGTFPIAAWRVDGVTTWGCESAMLAAGTNVQWLRDDMGLINSSDESHTVAQECTDSGGVWYVPALMGLGTPRWDYGARSAFFGITRGTSRPQMVRAVLEGIAHRGADLVAAAEADGRVTIPALRIDGGMSDNPTFVQALADATQRVVEISPVREATTRGAALFAMLALGAFGSIDELAGTWNPKRRYEPGAPLDRARWGEAVARAARWIPELSGIDF